jgi:hypothetical protein
MRQHHERVVVVATTGRGAPFRPACGETGHDLAARS